MSMLFNRDLSWLGFNYRVLLEAGDKEVPLYERIKFLSIFSSNLDEFFRVRYPAVFAFSKLNTKTQQKAAPNTPEDIAERTQSEINRQLNIFGKTLTQEIIPGLKANNIYFYYNELIRPEHTPEIREIFLSRVLSFIQPIFLEGNISNKFFPENNHLYLIVTFKSTDAFTNRHAVINIPSNKIDRFFVLSPVDSMEYVIFLDDIIRENLNCIFPGLEILGVYSIKFNRDAELKFDDVLSEDIINKIEKQLKKRDMGPPSRFLFEAGMPRNVQLYLASVFELKYEEMFEGGRYHNLRDLNSFPSFNKRLEYPSLKPIPLTGVSDCGDIFNVLHTKDILLHLPYQSYNAVLSFFNQAAIDPEVTEIQITLYRVASESHIVNALISAAKNGKKVTAFVELKARFDEANNIKWSRTMQDAGVRIVYSVPEIKVHSKIATVRKKFGNEVLTYGILSTGNFNESTARFYTDHVLMTTDPAIVKEMLALFKYLQKDGKIANKTKEKFSTLLVSQFNMIDRFNALIEQETAKAQAGEKGLIRVKVNNLEDPQMINMLYRASKAGVEVDLIVRGICCLVPAVAGESENITVKRLVDRYLEHTRLFIFGTGDNPEVIMGSSDWMIRNLHHRIEVCVSIKKIECKRQLIDYFDIQWKDNSKAVALTTDLDFVKISDRGDEKINAQYSIYKYLQERI